MTSFPASLGLTVLDALEPLREATESEEAFFNLIDRFGWSTGPATSIGTIRAALGLNELIDAAAEIGDQFGDPEADQLELAARLQAALRPVFERLQTLASAPPSGLPPPLDADSEFWIQLPRELVDYLLLNLLERRQPVIFAVLMLLGLAEVEPHTPPGADRHTYVRYQLHWDRLPDVVRDPAGAVRARAAWGSAHAQFRHGDLVRLLERFNLALGLPARREPAAGKRLASAYYAEATGSAPPEVDELAVPFLSGSPPHGEGYVELGLVLLPIPPPDQPQLPPAGVLLTTLAQGYATGGTQLSPAFRLELRGGFDATGAMGVELYPGEARLALQAPRLDARLALVGRPPEPWHIVGAADGHRVELSGAHVALGFRGTVIEPELLAEIGTGVGADAPKLAFVLRSSDADGFLQKLIGAEPQRFEFGGLLSWSSKTGLAFAGEADAKFKIPINRSLGPIDITSLTAGFHADTASKGVSGYLAVSGSAKLGPISASVDAVGATAKLQPRPPGATSGTLGNLDFVVGFKPPDGAGLSIDAGPVSGGGYLFFDPRAGQYAGVVQLEFKAIALTAIGLLTTRMPDGSKGFSLLVIISAEFPPIQLGFGFTLTGAGGLLGINRTANVEALRAGVKSRAVESVMFPPDPVKNAPQIVSNLGTFFPPAPERFVFGPMARIGWGTPTLIALDVGLVLELPAPVRLIVLGKLHLTLPNPKAPVVSIKMDVLGVLDFERREASVDATLYDSRVAGLAVTGDMAMRLSWGPKPAFALAAGGFNPRFDPPAGFPALDRVALPLGTRKSPRLRLEAYLALTSNTAQVGARLDLYAEALGFSVAGYLFFDALFRFSPFEFIVDMAGGLALKRGDRTLGMVTFELTLSGPSPWHAHGKATFKVWIFSGEVAFDVTVGRTLTQAATPPVDAGRLLDVELKKPANWTAQLPPEGESLVALRKLEPLSRELLAHPLGALSFRQRAVPLGVEIQKVGAAPVAGERRFDVTAVRLGAVTAPPEEARYLRDLFAPGQFLELSEDEKLSRPSFEEMRSGYALATPAAEVDPIGAALPTAALGYEARIVDAPEAPARAVGAAPMSGPTLARLAHTGAAGLAATRATGAARFRAPGLGVRVSAPAYTVAAARGGTGDGLPAMPAGRLSYTEVADLLRRAERREADGGTRIVTDVAGAGR